MRGPTFARSSTWVARIRPDDLPKPGEPHHDFMLYVRVLERGQVVSPIHTVPLRMPTGEAAQLQEWVRYRVSFSMRAIVRPGKYRIELALLDRTTGRYSTRYEDVTVEGKENDPVERSFQAFSRFEFLPETKSLRKRERPR